MSSRHVKTVPLSPQQYRLVRTAGHLFDNEEMQSALTLYFNEYRRKTISVDEISDALMELMARHDALRLFVKHGEGGWVQQEKEIVRSSTLACIMAELVSSDEAKRQRVRELLAKPFPLDEPYMWRCHVLQCEDETVIVFRVSHLIVDGLSAQILGKEFSKILDRGADASVKVRTSYITYCKEADEADRREVLRRAEGYWRTVFDSVYTPFSLTPMEGLTPDTIRYSHRRQREQRLPPNLVAQTKGFAICAAAAGLATAALVDRHDVVINFFHHGRTTAVAKNAVGCYYHVIPLRLQMEPSQKLKDVAVAAGQGVQDAIAYCDYDIGMIIDDLFGGITHGRKDSFPLTTFSFNFFSLEELGMLRSPDPAAIIQEGPEGVHSFHGRRNVYDMTVYAGLSSNGSVDLAPVYRSDRLATSEVEWWVQLFYDALHRMTTEDKVGDFLCGQGPGIRERVRTVRPDLGAGE